MVDLPKQRNIYLTDLFDVQHDIDFYLIFLVHQKRFWQLLFDF